MDKPRYTVIVPMLEFRGNEPVLASLRENVPAAGGLQIIVALGRHPARQRNAAVSVAQGEFVLFFDNDCSLDASYWGQLDADFARPEVEIVGGPACLRARATWWENVFHALLTQTLIVGSVSSRYSPRGLFRVATGTDLILCNLAVRRATFARIGPLSTQLYPNEENEWLDRAQAAGVGAFYDPRLQVSRPQRQTPSEMGWALLRYGMGRTRQFRVSGWRFTFHQVLPFLAAAALFAVFRWNLEEEFALLWLVAALVVGFSLEPGLSLAQRAMAGLLAPLIPLTYAVGQAVGWVALLASGPPASNGIELVDEHGEPLTQCSEPEG